MNKYNFAHLPNTKDNDKHAYDNWDSYFQKALLIGKILCITSGTNHVT